MNDHLLYIFLPVIIGICAMVLQFQFMHTTEAKRRAWSLAGLAVLWIPAVLIVARYLCSYARTVEECFTLWTIAFGLCCLTAGIQGTILFFCRSKRDIKELDRMKLRDL